MKMRLWLIGQVGWILLFGKPGWAVEDEDMFRAFGDEAFVTIATGITQPLVRAPSVATVITARDIEAMGARTLDEALESVPGLHVSLSSARFSPVYSIRGIHSDKNPHVLVLVNGTPITQLLFGDRGQRFTLPVQSIGRIEVIRGPGSAVYGSDAFAGVVNVITKGAGDLEGTRVGGRAGSFDSQDAWLLHGFSRGSFEAALSIEYTSTDGDNSRVIESDAQSFFDAVLGTSASLAPGPVDTAMERLDIRLGVNYNDWYARFWNWRQTDAEPGPGASLALDPAGTGDTDNYLIETGFDDVDLGNDWGATFKLSYMDINSKSKQRLFPLGTVLPIASDGNVNPLAPAGLVSFPEGFIGNPEVYERHARLDLSAIHTGSQRHRWRLAAGMHYADLKGKETKNFGPGVIDGTQPVVDGTVTDVTDTPFVFIKERDRWVYYASLQDQWSIAPDWELTAGVRADHYSDFGATVNPRLALVWQSRHDLTTKLLYGRAFRAPSFAELFFINNPIALGNPDLDPEVIHTVEVEFDYRMRSDLRSKLSVFGYRARDLIEFTADPGGTSFTARNTADRDGYGLEMEAAWDITPGFSVSGNYALQHSEDQETGRDAGNAPRHQAWLDMRWRFGSRWELSSQLNWVGRRERTANDVRDELDDYTNVDLTLRGRELVGALDLAVSVRNLFDTDQREPSPGDASNPSGSLVPGDFPLRERSIYGEARYRF